MRLALAQLDAVVGDLDGNRALIVDAIREASDAGADLVVFPELAVTGYPPEDLLLRPGFIKAARASLERDRRLPPRGSRPSSAARSSTATSQTPAPCCPTGSCAASTASSSCRTTASSTSTATSPPGESCSCCGAATCSIGPTICEDIWQPGPPATDLALGGRAADRQPLRFAVPRRQGRGPRGDARHPGARQRVLPRLLQPRRRPGRARLRRPLRRARRRGRGDRPRSRLRGGLLVVDLDPTEAIGRRLRDVRRRELERSRESVPPCDRDRAPAARAERDAGRTASSFRSQPELEQMRLALGLGLRDYVQKNGFREVVLGISGGIDSALTAAICADALGHRPRPHGLDAVALLVGGDARRRARGEREPRRRLPRDPDRGRSSSAFARGARSLVRGPRARPDRGEPPGASPRARC